MVPTAEFKEVMNISGPQYGRISGSIRNFHSNVDSLSICCSTCGCHFHARFDAQVFGDALDDQAKIARGGVAVAMEHPVQRLFTQAGLPRQFFERDLRVNQIAKYGKTLSH